MRRGLSMIFATLGLATACATDGVPDPWSDTAAAVAEREMCAALKRQLFQDSIVRSYSVYPRCDQGRVTLNGSVPDFRARQQAEQIAMGMPGVTRVQNNLRVLDQDDPIRY